VPVLGVHRRDRLERAHPLIGRLTDPDEDPRGEWNAQLARGADGVEPPRRVLGR
jgi:hypothetical protein